MSDVSFDCEHCGHNLIVDEKGIGLTVPCPICGKSITIPSPAFESGSASTGEERPRLTHSVHAATKTPAEFQRCDLQARRRALQAVIEDEINFLRQADTHVTAACPRCKNSHLLACPNCCATDGIDLASTGATCRCGQTIAQVECPSCKATIYAKLFQRPSVPDLPLPALLHALAATSSVGHRVGPDSQEIDPDLRDFFTVESHLDIFAEASLSLHPKPEEKDLPRQVMLTRVMTRHLAPVSAAIEQCNARSANGDGPVVDESVASGLAAAKRLTRQFFLASLSTKGSLDEIVSTLSALAAADCKIMQSAGPPQTLVDSLVRSVAEKACFLVSDTIRTAITQPDGYDVNNLEENERSMRQLMAIRKITGAATVDDFVNACARLRSRNARAGQSCRAIVQLEPEVSLDNSETSFDRLWAFLVRGNEDLTAIVGPVKSTVPRQPDGDAKYVWLAAGGCLLFSLLGFWMISDGEAAGGWLCVLFFGGGGLAVVVRYLAERANS